MTKTLLIVAGGTGGHLYPGVALARELASGGWSVAFIVRHGDLGQEVLSREGFPVHEMTGQGLPRRLSWRASLFPFRLAAGSTEALRLLRRIRPQCVVGMGGYLSFPVLATARLLGIRTLIHEQNVVPGLSNRLLARVVNGVAISFEESRPYFSNRNTFLSGLPVRAEIGTLTKDEARRELGIDLDGATFLVFGGSQGARRLNHLMIDAWKQLSDKGTRFQVIHITGDSDFEAIQSEYRRMTFKSLVLPYCHRMAAAYAAADLVVCRSGASTVAELIAAHRPAVFVPFPFASANHQYYNALVLERRQLAQVLIESKLTLDSMTTAITHFLSENESAARESRFQQLERDSLVRQAAKELAGRIETVYN